jgi:Protein kinase domain/Domain found in Dishevelled, Egl-10, and Pleckstrin (DEP)/Protein of unknown function, DUF547
LLFVFVFLRRAKMMGVDAEASPDAREVAEREGWFVMARSSEGISRGQNPQHAHLTNSPNMSQSAEARLEHDDLLEDFDENEEDAAVEPEPPAERKDSAHDGANAANSLASGDASIASIASGDSESGSGSTLTQERHSIDAGSVSESADDLFASFGAENSKGAGRRELLTSAGSGVGAPDTAMTLTDVLIFLQDNVKEQDRRVLLSKHLSCFVGSEAIDLLVKEQIGADTVHAPAPAKAKAPAAFPPPPTANRDASTLGKVERPWRRKGSQTFDASDRSGALEVMQQLLDAGLVAHVTDTTFQLPTFRDGSSLYRFVRDGMSEAEVDRLLLAMWDQEEGITVMNRRYIFKMYPRVLVGDQAVDWMVDQLKCTPAEAVELGNCLLGRGVLRHVTEEHHFKAKGLFYRWHKDEGEDTGVEGERPPLNTAKRVRGLSLRGVRSGLDADKFLSNLYGVGGDGGHSPAIPIPPPPSPVRSDSRGSMIPSSPMLSAPTREETGELAVTDPVAFSIFLEKELLQFFADYAFTIDGTLAFGRGQGAGYSRRNADAHLNSPAYHRIMLLSCQLQLCDPGVLGPPVTSHARVAFFLNVSHCLLMHAHIAAGGAPRSVAGARLVATENKYMLKTGIYSIADIAALELFNADALGEGDQSMLAQGSDRIPRSFLHFCHSFGTTASPRIRPFTGKNLVREVENHVREFFKTRVSLHLSTLYIPAVCKWFARDLLGSAYAPAPTGPGTADQASSGGRRGRRRQLSASELVVRTNSENLAVLLHHYFPPNARDHVKAMLPLSSSSAEPSGDGDHRDHPKEAPVQFAKFEWEPAYGEAEALRAELSENLSNASPILDQALRDNNVPLIPRAAVDVGPRIGVGGCAEVFKAMYDRRIVALKRLFAVPRSADDPGSQKALDEFAKELALVSHLESDHIVALLGACVEADTYSIVFEYMSLGSVFDIIHVHKTKLPLAQRIRFMLDTAKGLAYLHSKVPILIHRDVKVSSSCTNCDGAVTLAR